MIRTRNFRSENQRGRSIALSLRPQDPIDPLPHVPTSSPPSATGDRPRWPASQFLLPPYPPPHPSPPPLCSGHESFGRPNPWGSAAAGSHRETCLTGGSSPAAAKLFDHLWPPASLLGSGFTNGTSRTVATNPASSKSAPEWSTGRAGPTSRSRRRRCVQSAHLLRSPSCCAPLNTSRSITVFRPNQTGPLLRVLECGEEAGDDLAEVHDSVGRFRAAAPSSTSS